MKMTMMIMRDVFSSGVPVIQEERHSASSSEIKVIVVIMTNVLYSGVLVQIHDKLLILHERCPSDLRTGYEFLV